jgi:hypothetical protein
VCVCVCDCFFVFVSVLVCEHTLVGSNSKRKQRDISVTTDIIIYLLKLDDRHSGEWPNRAVEFHNGFSPSCLESTCCRIIQKQLGKLHVAKVEIRALCLARAHKQTNTKRAKKQTNK